MFGFFRKWSKRRAWEAEAIAEKHAREMAAYQFGRDTGEKIYLEVNGWLDRRLDDLTLKLLSTLKERFNTIYDEPNHAPLTVAAIELKIFMGHMDGTGSDDGRPMRARLRAEAETALDGWIKLAREMGQGEIIDKFIDDRIFATEETIYSRVELMWTEIKDKEASRAASPE